jgi:hypothetical protein
MTDKFEKIKSIVQKIFNLDTQKIIFIYTPPKVGSTTLVTSLRVSLGKTCNVIHVHDDVMLNILTGINDVTINDIIYYLAEQGKEVYVIDVYRTPIERKISEFFEKIALYHFNNSEVNVSNYKVERVIERFNNLFPYLALGDHYFEKYNIAEPIAFDFIKKYTIQEMNKIKFIKIRLCDSDNWGNILTEILQTEIVKINDYQTDNKLIGELYKKFKDYYKLPPNFLDLIKSCKYFNFYYSEEERNKYLEYWQNKVCNEFLPYTVDEYNFYTKLSLENQYNSEIQINHYIDNGCVCDSCQKKRLYILIKAKRGEDINEKIIHDEVVKKVLERRIERRIERVKKVIEVINKKPIKFKKNQFLINNIT